jgi:hypothetical protein
VVLPDEGPARGFGLARSAQQERFGDAFLTAIASVAGCTMAKPAVDNDSIDWTLSCRLPLRPKIDVQMKTTTNDSGDPAFIRYALKKKNYDDLTLQVSTPRILVLVVVPDHVEEWLALAPTHLVLRRSAHWLSLAGLPPSDNAASVTIDVPRQNLLTPGALQGMMQRINSEGRL